MQIQLAEKIHAPIDLVWEFVVESSFEPDLCPVSGLQGGKILEEYEDGLLREVVFNGRSLRQRVFIEDTSYCCKAEFTGENEGGTVTNTLKDLGDHITSIEIECEWSAPDLTDLHRQELQTLFEERLKVFKQKTEDLWAEKGSVTQTTSISTMH